MFPYIGGKSKQAKWISSFFPRKYSTYVEVFGGAFWVGVQSHIKAKKIVYNDFNPMLYNLWLCIKQYDKMLAILESMEPHNEELYKESVDAIQSIMENNEYFEKPDFDIAKPYSYWATHSFSGNMSGMSTSNCHLPMIKRLKSQKIRDKLDRMEVHNESFEKIIPMFDSEDTLFYVDPPYYSKEKYYKFHNFGLDSHKKLAEMIRSVKGKVVVSYYRTPEVEELYPNSEFQYEEKDYKKSSVYVKKGQKKSTGTELLLLNYKKRDDLNLFFSER